MSFKLNLVISIILVFILALPVWNATVNEALAECANIHHIKIENFNQANASFSKGKCMLTCWIGNTILATDSINEGKPCPEDTTGICRSGQCIGGQDNALHECGLKHRLDFHTMKDHKGTEFANDQCMLRCVIDGTQLSANPQHEGLHCPANPNGFCRRGFCEQTTNPGTTDTQQPSTAPTLPTTVSKPSIDSFDPWKMKLLNISLESTNPPLDRDKYIHVKYADQPNPNKWHSLCVIFGDSSGQNIYETPTIKDIPNVLVRTSTLSIGLYRARTVHMSEYHENLYALFAHFYTNHKLPFGQLESGFANFSIDSLDNSTKKLMDVSIRFTIMFE